MTSLVAQSPGPAWAARLRVARSSRALLWLPSPRARVATSDGKFAPIQLPQGRDLVVPISPGSRRAQGSWSGTEHTLVNLTNT